MAKLDETAAVDLAALPGPSMPGISVVIPTFHRYEALESTVSDLLRQTILPKQLIVVDNTTVAERKRPSWLVSTAKTECLYVSSAGAGNAQLARNEGLRLVTAHYVALFDDDMSVPGDCLESFLRVHSEGWDLVLGSLIEQGKLLESNHGGDRPFWNVLRHRHGTRRCQTIAVSSGFVSMKTEVIEALGYLDESFIYNYDDYDLGYRAWKAGYTIIHDPKVSAHHLKLEAGGSRQHLTGSKRSLNKYEAKYYFVLKHFSRTAVRIEFISDVLLTLMQNRLHLLQSLKVIRLLLKAFRRGPGYGVTDSGRTPTNYNVPAKPLLTNVNKA